MDWLANLVGSDDDFVTSEMLERMLVEKDMLCVLFCNEEVSCLSEDVMEDIEDDLEDIGLTFVKVPDAMIAQEYGIEQRPALVLFHKGKVDIVTHFTYCC